MEKSAEKKKELEKVSGEQTQKKRVSKTISSDITKLRKEDSYKAFEKGYFKNVPELQGYLYKFKVSDEPKIVLIIDTSNSGYSKSYYKSKGYHFIVYKASSIGEFIKNFFNYSSDIIDLVNHILDKAQEMKDIIAGGIPHGYKIDSNGDIVVDQKEAKLVREIYKMYTQYGSIREIANELKSNFSHVRDVLHDYRYEKMTPSIIQASTLKKVRAKMETNRKNRTT